MEEYKEYVGNSHKCKEKNNSVPTKKIEKIISGPIKTKKKSNTKKISEIFISEDASSVKSYILMDVVVPTIKKAIIDTIEIVFNGDTGHTKKTSSGSKVSYQRYYENDRFTNRSHNNERPRGVYDYDDIVFTTRGEAEKVLDGMFDLLEQYEILSVADFYELVGITGEYTHHKYGWTTLRGSEIKRLRGGNGYIINLPKALPIN